MRKNILFIFALCYQQILKRIFFLFDPEFVHNRMLKNGELLGRFTFLRQVIAVIFAVKNQMLIQTIAGIRFENPIGLSAGFDHDAHLTQILPAVGFGFGSVGTVTYHAYGGNPRPILGRLPKSRSLMVNKGYKSSGAEVVSRRLALLSFAIPIGISIGRSNVASLKNEKESIKDIVKAFQIFEEKKVKNAYYELNISCPNLYGDISFYPPKNLEALLRAVDAIGLSTPVFIKMPIELSDKEVILILDVILKHRIAGIIIGNLQKNRNDPALIPEEVAKFPVGNFSGKPTWNRSNALISLAYRYCGGKLVIIGCGGVFSADDAYEKILRGASLVQLITGMIFQGPQLIAEINLRLPVFLRRDGYANVADAVGMMHYEK